MNKSDIYSFCENFIRELLEINVHYIPHTADAFQVFLKAQYPDFMYPLIDHSAYQHYFLQLKEGKVYHLTDSFLMHYLMLVIEGDATVMILGPYITAPLTTDDCQKLVIANNLSSSLMTPLNLFHNTLPVGKNSKLIKALNLAASYFYTASPSLDYVHDHVLEKKTKKETDYMPVDSDLSIMPLIEQRYELENRMHLEILNGNTKAAVKLFGEFNTLVRDMKRSQNPLRSRKNISYIANTSFRRTVQRASIHPLYVDLISSNFSKQIELANSVEELEELCYQMVKDYCQLVRTHSLKHYSVIIQQAINYIQIHLNTELSLASISAAINISPNYLSNLFNKETKESITNFIHRKRIEKAAELLLLSYLPVQTIATYVGYHDMNYFTKMFKKYTGVTPSKYKITL